VPQVPEQLRDAMLLAQLRCTGHRYGDSLTTGWVQFCELIVVLYRQGVLPDTFTRALDGDQEVPKPDALREH
jgi:hypothetical protein